MLAARGWRVFVLDTRGHGASQRPAPGDDWRFDHWARRDIPAAARHLLDYTGVDRIHMVGHSAGGAALLASVAGQPELRPRAASLAVIGTPLPWLQPWRGVGARLIRWASLGLGRFPARALGLGPEDELKGVMSQWMRWNLRGDWTGDDGIDYSARLADLRTPFLSVAGTGDRFFAPPAACHGLFEQVGAADRTFAVFGTEHGHRRDYGHADLIVSRDAQAEVWPLLLDWLDSRRSLARRGGEA